MTASLNKKENPMARQVWKNEIEPGVTELRCGPIVHVDVDWRDKPSVWVEHDPATNVDRTIETIPTGFPVPDGAVHRGSFILRSENLVFHVYEHALAALAYTPAAPVVSEGING